VIACGLFALIGETIGDDESTGAVAA